MTFVDHFFCQIRTDSAHQRRNREGHIITTIQFLFETAGGGSYTVIATLYRDSGGGIDRIELTETNGNLFALLTTTETTWIVSPIEGDTTEVVRDESDFAADQVLLEEAVGAYLDGTSQTDISVTRQVPGSGGNVDPPPPEPEERQPSTEGVCFAGGTWIATPTGEKAVEHLATGDLVQTYNGPPVRVLWIGRQTLHKTFGTFDERLCPVKIVAGAFGDGRPHSDLTVTENHGMIIDGLVINASALINGSSIDRVPSAELPDSVTYFHIETEAHDVVLANGAATETFVDCVGRQAFDNHAEYIALYGAERIIPEMDVPRLSSQRLVPQAIRERLGIPDEPEFHWDDLAPRGGENAA